MPSLAAARISNAAYSPTFIPTYVGVGATAGIGRAMVQAFAHYTNGRAHFVIVGRNAQAARSILNGLPKPDATDAEGVPVEYIREFLPCDIRLMKNVRETSGKLLRSLDKINFLVLSAGVFSLRGFQPTEEGIDEKLAGRYYSRWVFTRELLPLLKKAQGEGESGSVMTILAGGTGPKVDLNDLGLKKNYSGMAAMMGSATYNDLMVAEFAKREPDLAFTHIFPGFVDTSAAIPSNFFLRSLYTLFYPLIWLASVTPEVCAEHMLFALLDNENGASICNAKGNNIGVPKHGQIGDEAQSALWDHSLEETK